MELEKLRVGVLVEFNYENLEVRGQQWPVLFPNATPFLPPPSLQVWYPLLRFREEGIETFTIGPEAGKVYQSKKGYPCKADQGIDSVTPQVHCLADGAITSMCTCA